jgi:histidinol-phosphate/aromatic aminotransferase/cobyric acid decarboxylase-like protein
MSGSALEDEIAGQISSRISGWWSGALSKENIILTNSEQNSMFLILSNLLKPKDQVLLITPTNQEILQILGYLHVKVQVFEVLQFSLTVADWAPYVENIDAVIIVTPNAFTGMRTAHAAHTVAHRGEKFFRGFALRAHAQTTFTLYHSIVRITFPL